MASDAVIGTAGSGDQSASNVWVGTAGAGNQDAIRGYIGTAGSGNQVCFLHLPGQPSGLTVSPNASAPSAALDLSWAHHAVYDTATAWKIERSPDGTSNWATLESNWTGGTSYTDSGLNAGETWYYRVSGINYQGTGTASSVASGTTTLATPQNFTATHDMSACPTIQVDLSWSNGGRSEQKTLQVWNDNTSSWDYVSTTISASATTYNDHQPTWEQMTPEGSVQYRIKFNSETSWATATTLAVCPE